VSPRGLLLRVWSRNDLDHDGSIAWTLEILSCGCVVAVASSLVDVHLAKVAARVGELVGLETMSAVSERDVAWCVFRGAAPSEVCASMEKLARLVSVADG